MQPWVEKYAPQKVEEVVGQSKSVEEFMNWFQSWKSGDKARYKAALLFGAPGRGKTAIIYALANEKNLDLVEVNASDERNKDKIEELLGNTIKQRSLFHKGKIILVDEIDGLSGREDRGGAAALIQLIKDTKFPMVLTANDPYDPKLRSLRNYTKMIKFGNVHLNSITSKLSEICFKEEVEVEKDVLKQIGRMSGGDLRSAINDLETLARGKGIIEKGDLEVLGYREQEQNVFEVLKVIFKTQNLNTAIRIINSVDKDPEEVFWWLEENILSEYEDPKEIAKAFDALSKADVFRNRIYSRQYWRFKKYMIDLMSGGVALAKKEPYRKFTNYSYPKRLMMYGRTKDVRKRMNEMTKHIGARLHTSSKIVKGEYLPLLKIIFENKKDWKENLIEEFELTEDQVELMMANQTYHSKPFLKR